MSGRALLVTACFARGLVVILGAFGAHVLRGKLSPEALVSFDTGVRYQFIHALAIFAAVWLADRSGLALPLAAGWLFTAGMVLFSGSIYLLATRGLLGIETWRWLGPITPLGGLCFVAGWGTLLAAALRMR